MWPVQRQQTNIQNIHSITNDIWRKSEPESRPTGQPAIQLLCLVLLLLLPLFHLSEKKQALWLAILQGFCPYQSAIYHSVAYSTIGDLVAPIFPCFLLAPWLAVPWSGFAVEFSGWSIPKAAAAACSIQSLASLH